MNIIIVGCGRVGETLSRELTAEGNSVTVIDADAEIIERLCARYDVRGVVGNGATAAVQAEAGIESVDLFIAVTGSDELNLLCCMVAKKKRFCQTVARVKNPDYNAEASYLKNELGLTMVINPEQVVAEEIARLLRFPSAINIDTFAKGRVELVTFRLPEESPLVGLSVKDVLARFRADVLICTIERGEEAYIAYGDFVFAAKDYISVVATPSSANDFFAKIKYKTHPVKDVMIAGGGEITSYLCPILLRDGLDVKIIERDAKTCDRLAVDFSDATVIEANLAEKETLLEEGIATAGAVVALTDHDEENIFLSLYAKNLGKGKVITKISRTDFDEMIKYLDLDTVICPENYTTDMLLRYIRATKNAMGSNVETLYSLVKGKVEAAEFIVREDSPIIGKPISELPLRRGVLVAAILRGERVIIPRGYDTIEASDAVVVVSDKMALHDISDILK